MATLELDIARTFSQAEDYNVDIRKETKISFFEKIARWYADSLHNYYEKVRNTNYSPFEISPQEASAHLKDASKLQSQFASLAKKYERINDGDDELLADIHDHLEKIAKEFEIAKEYLSNLSDPDKHAKIRVSIGSLYDSKFFED